MDDKKVIAESHQRSPFQLSKKFDKPFNISIKSAPTNGLNNESLSEETSSSEQPSPQNIMSPNPFSLSLKKLGSYSLSSSNSLSNSSLQNSQKISELQQEILNLKKEIEAKDTKLSSTVKSIKQFWSPELKKERVARKEEREKYLKLKERLCIANTEIQECKKTLEDLEHELNTQQQKSKYLMQQLEDQKTDSSVNNSLNILKKNHEEKISLFIEEKKCYEEKICQLQYQLENYNNSVNLSNEKKNISNNSQVTNEKLEKQEEEINLLTAALDELEAKYNELLEENEEKSKCISDLEIILVDKEQKEQYHESVLVQLQTCHKTLENQEKQYLILKDEQSILKENERKSLEKISNLEMCLADKETQLIKMSEEVQKLLAQERTHTEHISELEELFLSKDKQFDMLQKELELLQHQLYESEKKSEDNSKDEEITILRKSVESLNTNLKTVELQNSVNKEKLSKVVEELSNLKNEMTLKEKELNEYLNKFSDASNELLRKDAALKICNEEIKEYKRASLNFQMSNDALQADLSEKNSLLLRLKKEKDTQLSKTVSLVVYEDMKKECECLSSVNLQQKMTLEDLQRDLKSALEANSKLELELSKMNKEYTENKNQNKEFQQSNKDLMKDLQDTKSKLESFEKHERRSTLLIDKKKVEDNQRVKQLQEENTQKLNRIVELEKQLTEKNKQLSLIKKTQSSEKEKQHQLVNEKLKIEAEVRNQVEQLKDELVKKKERINVLEDALRESVNIAIEREDILASQEEATEQAAEKIEAMKSEIDRTAFEKAITNIKNAFLILLMGERDALIASMKATRRRHSEELQNIRVNNLLSSISEKDTQIAHFEMSNSKIKRNEIIQLKKDKEKLMEELKEQNNIRVLEVNQDSSEDLMFVELRDAPSEQVYEAIRHLCNGISRLEFYIEDFMALMKKKNIELCNNIEEPPKKFVKFTTTEKLSKDELMKELKSVTDHGISLKKYVEGLLSKLEG